MQWFENTEDQNDEITRRGGKTLRSSPPKNQRKSTESPSSHLESHLLIAFSESHTGSSRTVSFRFGETGVGGTGGSSHTEPEEVRVTTTDFIRMERDATNSSSQWMPREVERPELRPCSGTYGMREKGLFNLSRYIVKSRHVDLRKKMVKTPRTYSIVHLSFIVRHLSHATSSLSSEIGF